MASEHVDEIFASLTGQTAPVLDKRLELPNAYFEVRTAWRIMALLCFVTVAASAAVLAFDVVPLAGGAKRGASIVVAACVIMPPLWWWAGEKRLNARLLHIPEICGFVSIYIGLRQTGFAETRVLLIYLMPFMFAALFMSRRAAIGYSIMLIGILADTHLRHADEGVLVVVNVFVTGIAAISVAAVATVIRAQLSDVAEQAQLLSGQDALTGLANLRRLHQQLDFLIKRSAHGGREVTLFMIDLDEFKQVNDRHSHSVGDAVIRATAKAIVTTMRREEMVARRGGDEFAIVAEGVDHDEAEALVTRVKDAVSAARLGICPDLPSTVTVGYASQESNDTPSKLMARADAMLHVAKAVSPARMMRDREFGEDA